MVRFQLMLLLTLILVPFMARAESAAKLRQFVENNTQQMMQKVHQNKALYKSEPDKFYHIMDQTMEHFFDFRLIAARVMGRYVHQASPAQRHAFLQKFKRSLFNTYAQPLVKAKNYSIKVKEVHVNPHNHHRARVNLQVISGSGSHYPVQYSMHQKQNGQWMLENIIVQGVNIGLAFRERFAQDMEKDHNNIEKVINNWSGKVKKLEKKDDSTSSSDS